MPSRFPGPPRAPAEGPPPRGAGNAWMNCPVCNQWRRTYRNKDTRAQHCVRCDYEPGAPNIRRTRGDFAAAFEDGEDEP